MILEGSYAPTAIRACLSRTWSVLRSSYRQVQSQRGTLVFENVVQR